MSNETRESVIAIVDDQQAVREAIESLFRAAGFAAECFDSAEAFIRSGCARRASCIVLDVQLPGMSGLELQRHLAAVGLRIPTIVVTARYDAGGGIRRQAMSQGASAFLAKPFGGGDLLAAVRAAFAPAG